MKKRFRASADELSEVMGFTEEELEKSGYSIKDIMMAQVAVEEIFANIAGYAYPDGEGYCDMEMKSDDTGMTIVFTDEGIAFNPLDQADPDINCDAENRPIGGLGIYMTKTIMDDVQYRRCDDQNILTMIKKKVM